MTSEFHEQSCGNVTKLEPGESSRDINFSDKKAGIVAEKIEVEKRTMESDFQM